MSNSTLDTIILCAQADVEQAPEAQEVDARFGNLIDRVQEEMGRDTAQELFEALGDVVRITGRRMFEHGWRLRGNPEALKDLPDLS